MRTLSVVLPSAPASPHIPEALAEYRAALAQLGAEWELLLVPDATDAGSVEQARALAGERVAVAPADGPGWGRAVKTGLGAATGDVLAYANSSRTSGETLALVASIALERDVVAKPNRRSTDGVAQRLGSLAFNAECRFLFDLADWDVNATPKAFPRSFDRLLHIEEDGDLFDLELIAVCRRERYPLVEAPVDTRPWRLDWPKRMVPWGARNYVDAVRLRRRLGSPGRA